MQLIAGTATTDAVQVDGAGRGRCRQDGLDGAGELRTPLHDPGRRQRADDAVYNVFFRRGTSRSFSKPLQGDLLSLFEWRRWV